MVPFIGGVVLTSATEPTTVIRSAAPEFNVLMSLSALLMVGLLVATLQALRHGDAASLWRVYLGVAPACVLALFVARPFATLISKRSTNSRRVPPTRSSNVKRNSRAR